MSGVEWLHESPLDTSDTLEIFEKDFNVNLPKSFKSFIALNNYAAPVPDSITINGFGETDVKRLLSFNHSDVETVYQVADYFSKIKLVPFASDSLGNHFCLSGERVSFWEHETDTQYNLQCDFSEFLKMIH
jgi:hypothetical protein